MLGALLTVAARAAAGPIGLGERAEDEVGGQLLEPAEEGRAGPGARRNRCHRLRLSATARGLVNENRALGLVSGLASRQNCGRRPSFLHREVASFCRETRKRFSLPVFPERERCAD
jgi:hypothetical protein